MLDPNKLSDDGTVAPAVVGIMHVAFVHMSDRGMWAPFHD